MLRSLGGKTKGAGVFGDASRRPCAFGPMIDESRYTKLIDTAPTEVFKPIFK